MTTHFHDLFIPSVTIASPCSGSGKTTVTLALAAALRGQGQQVQCFKVGPDTIDLALHSALTGRPGHTLDAFLMGKDLCQSCYTQAIQPADKGTPADFALIEGVMGLFDGISGSDERCSTAQMAQWLGAPILLVVNTVAQGRSVAALVRGFLEFDQQLPFLGVVCNNIGSVRHKNMLATSLSTYVPQLPCFGFLPRLKDLEISSRHLGLYWDGGVQGITEEVQDMAARLRAHALQYLDIEGIQKAMRIAASEKQRNKPEYMDDHIGTEPWEASCLFKETLAQPRPVEAAPLRIGVARDEAFCFSFAWNENILRHLGAELVFFSPLHDDTLPADIGGIVFGGGYPELYAEKLAANKAMLKAIHDFADAGRPIYAEGGGFLYLMELYENPEGNTYAFVGLFPVEGRLFSRLQGLGYREVHLEEDCLLGGPGTVLRGHAYHYTGMAASGAGKAPGIFSVAKVLTVDGENTSTGFYRPEQYPQVTGSYVRLHFATSLSAIMRFTQACATR